MTKFFTAHEKFDGKVFARHTFLPHTRYVQQRMNNEGSMILGPLMHLGPFSLRAPQGLVPPTSEIISPALPQRYTNWHPWPNLIRGPGSNYHGLRASGWSAPRSAWPDLCGHGPGPPRCHFPNLRGAEWAVRPVSFLASTDGCMYAKRKIKMIAVWVFSTTRALFLLHQYIFSTTLENRLRLKTCRYAMRVRF